MSPGAKRAYNSWRTMRQRCKNPRRDHADRYIGRGISICSRWDTFASFLADMGERPDGTTLERKDNDAGYEPWNCIWASQGLQTRNYSRNILITLSGETRCLKDWAVLAGVPYNTALHRLHRGWSPERSLRGDKP